MSLPICKKLYSKITYINIKPHALKLLEEKKRNIIQLKGAGKDFLKRTMVTQVLIAKIDKWFITKLKSFCTVKG